MAFVHPPSHLSSCVTVHNATLRTSSVYFRRVVLKEHTDLSKHSSDFKRAMSLSDSLHAIFITHGQAISLISWHWGMLWPLSFWSAVWSLWADFPAPAPSLIIYNGVTYWGTLYTAHCEPHKKCHKFVEIPESAIKKPEILIWIYTAMPSTIIL